MRDTPSCFPASASQRSTNPKYMQFLSLSYYQAHGFIYTSQPPEKSHNSSMPSAVNPVNATTEATTSGAPTAAPSQTAGAVAPVADKSPMVMTTVPLPSCGSLFQHFVYAAQPFWCHRHTITVPGGAVYDVGDFRVRIGDVRQTLPTARVRGTVIEIEWRGPSLITSITSQYVRSRRTNGLLMVGELVDDDDDSGIDISFADGIEEADIDAEYAATTMLIREFWAKLGIEGAREASLLPDIGKEVKEQLYKLKQQRKPESHTMTNGKQSGQQVEEDPDPTAGVDVARQFMEIFRFNR
ncbi:uncharacterized protein ATNIH1004_004732 [Aspergillus tanneri]|nr:uncharacterized protein ATNIH1004_004732 [Aspergillus tanneri]KAA8648846.1 hypothetical protein ATNIH1004_004732 [Aspergillus tanneri]